MTNSVTPRQRPGVPDVLHGEIYQNVGKYARGAIMFAFQQVGGAEGLAEWAEDNKSDFYIKLFPKIVTRESEVHHVKTLDDLMDVIDGDYEVASEIIDADPAAMLITDSDWYLSEEEDDRDDDRGWNLDNYVDFPDDQ